MLGRGGRCEAVMQTNRPQTALLLLLITLCILAEGLLSGRPFNSTSPLRRAAKSAPLCNTADEYCNRLTVFYLSTQGWQWRNNTNWLTNASYCDWFGITCSGGTPWRLRFVNNKLRGSLPSEVGQMPGVRQLEFFNETRLRCLPRYTPRH